MAGVDANPAFRTWHPSAETALIKVAAIASPESLGSRPTEIIRSAAFLSAALDNQ